MKRAGQASGRLVSTERWRNQVAARKVARAQDQRDPETARSGAEPAPDRVELFRRPCDGLRVFEGRRDRRPEVVRCRRLGRRPFAAGGGPAPGGTHTRTQSPEPDYASLRHELQTNKYV